MVSQKKKIKKDSGSTNFADADYSVDKSESYNTDMETTTISYQKEDTNGGFNIKGHMSTVPSAIYTRRTSKLTRILCRIKRIIKLSSTRSYGMNGFTFKFTIDQTITFNECNPFRKILIAVTRNVVIDDSNNDILRFSSTNQLKPIAAGKFGGYGVNLDDGDRYNNYRTVLDVQRSRKSKNHESFSLFSPNVEDTMTMNTMLPVYSESKELYSTEDVEFSGDFVDVQGKREGTNESFFFSPFTEDTVTMNMMLPTAGNVTEKTHATKRAPENGSLQGRSVLIWIIGCFIMSVWSLSV
ncbi:unnamed protein product [Mytilus coruscus]|uniref:Uncharacterized protein n=1 Tax=Mytilus coruscus TaxID=42192 RepID=A0A6J7ZZM3_MYTCO|nr:unnamed protein product [Mytilus coruscus]